MRGNLGILGNKMGINHYSTEMTSREKSLSYNAVICMFVSTLHSNNPQRKYGTELSLLRVPSTYQPGPVQISAHGYVIDGNQYIANLFAQKFETASSNANCNPAFSIHKN